MAEDSWNLFQEEVEEFQVKGLYDEEKSFLPEGCFSRLVTPDRVRVLLPRASESLVVFICSKARKVLLTLMCRYSDAQVLAAMKLFQQHNFTDEFLPIEDLERKCTIRQSGSQNDEKLECTHSVVLNVFHEDWWKPFRFSRFRQDQWTFCAPVFRKNEFRQKFCAGTILPFTSVSKKPKNGHFSKVFEAKLHGDHKDDPEVKTGEDIHVAVKILEDLPSEKGYNVETAWGQETDALEKISQLRHKHLIRRIAAFKRGKEHFIVFEWANGGTLRDVWEKHDTENLQLDGDRIMGLLEQLRGLAGALCALHSTNSRTKTAFATGTPMLNTKTNRNQIVASPSARRLDNEKAPRITIKVDFPSEDYYDAGGDNYDYDSSDSETSSGDEHWRHGDLKPDNILKFRGATCLGTLKIADLGLAKQHKFKTADRHDPTRQRYSTEQYEAPEVITNLSQPRSRRYDVWSMGCIIFESVVWLLYGYEGLKAFYREDKHIDKSTETLYFTAVGTPRTAKVSDIVKSWMGQILKDDPECNQPTKTALGDLLRLVQNKLLVVALPEPSMKPADMVNCRVDSAMLSTELERIWKDARDKDSYRFTGTRRKGVPRPTPLAGSRSKLSPGKASGAQSSEKIESTIRNLNVRST